MSLNRESTVLSTYLCGQNYSNKGMNAKNGLEIIICISEKSHIIATINNIIIIHAHRHSIPYIILGQ